jgi:DNA-binding MarR family transcriptional regulator
LTLKKLMSSDKPAIFSQLISEIRRSQAATQRFDRAVADAVGLNLTDMGCIDVLSQLGPMTAGQLASRTGLSTGAMTTALDRLESAGFARRVRDEQDRRRVMVELTEAVSRLDHFWAQHVLGSRRLYLEYTAEQMQLLLKFVRDAREFNETRAEEVERETRERPDS